MKVLRKVDPKQDFSHTFTCNRCRSECQAEFSDLRHRTGQGDNELFYVSCGVCSHPAKVTTILSDYLKDLVRAWRRETSVSDA